MSISIRVEIPANNGIQALTFLASGQQASMGLPSGIYWCKGETELEHTVLGEPCLSQCHHLIDLQTQSDWYVSSENGQRIISQWSRKSRFADGPIEIINA